MSSATIQLIIQALITYGPAVASEIQKLLGNNAATQAAPTQAQWDALFAMASKSYGSYVIGTTTA
jgi:hypothetical protein